MNPVPWRMLMFFLILLISPYSHADAGGCPARYDAVVDAYSGAITCVHKSRGGAGDDRPPAPPPLAALYMAVVAHPFTPRLWVSSGYLNAEDAGRVAMGACQSAMDKPRECRLMLTAHNSQYVGTARNSRGINYLSTSSSIATAGEGALRECQKESYLCKEGAMIYNALAQTDRFPTVPVKEYPAVTIAMPDQNGKRKPAVKTGGRYWLVSGLPASESIPAALSQCQKAFGVNCTVLRHSSGGLLAIFGTRDGFDYVVDTWEKSWLEKNVDKVCDPKMKCKLLDVFDSSDVADRIVD